MSEYWGYHLILDCKSGNNIDDKQNIKKFVKELVKKINMVSVGDPVIEYLAPNDINKAGFSLVQLIETSSIVGHFIDSNGDFYLDIFSCKKFEKDIIQKIKSEKPEIINEIQTSGKLEEKIEKLLIEVIENYKKGKI